MATVLSKIKPIQITDATFLGSAEQRGRLERPFWIATLGIGILFALAAEPVYFESGLGAILIVLAALLPAYIWCSGRIVGTPIYPIYALTFLWTYALPLSSQHPVVGNYDSAAHILAALTVSGCLLLGTAAWVMVSKYSSFRVSFNYRVLDSRFGDLFFFVILAAYTIFLVISMAGWLSIDVGLFSLLRATLGGINALSAFVLSYKWGRGELARKEGVVLCLLLLANMITSIASLLLIGALSLIALVAIAYILGHRRVPWIPLIGIILAVVMLHYGKASMRNQYWFNDESRAEVKPWQYPALLAEWFSYSLNYFTNSGAGSASEIQPFTERASLVHLLLLAQDKSPEEVPYLLGSTYTIIPELLIPRFLYPDKPASHEGTYLLNIHYGLQTREATAQTTIGWGLFNEAYANFGFTGCAILTILLGTAYGMISAWSLHAPILSARFLFAGLLLSIAFQTELSASVYITALFQSTIPLLFIAFFLMKSKQPTSN
jgi:hypothetical protein